jgi:hypothetical protein
MKNLLFPILSLIYIQSINAGSYQLLYGSTFLEEESEFILYADQWGNLLSSEYVGLLAAGYFDDGFDPFTESQNLTADELPTFLDSFNVIDSVPSTSVTNAGILTTSVQITDTGSGKTPYILFLTGVLSMDEASKASGIGLFNDTSFPTYPVGSLIPEPFDLRTKYDSIVLGNSENITNPLTGTVYQPIALYELPPSIGSSVQISGYWWDHDWFGVFYWPGNTKWLFHFEMGWVYPVEAPSSGIWFWHEHTSSWMYTNSETYSCIWGNNLQKWLYPYPNSNEFWIWNEGSQSWDPPSI